MIEWTSDQTTAAITFQGVLCIDQAEEVLASLRAVAQDPAPDVTLSFGGVEAVDVSFYQALHALRRTLEQQGRRIVVLPLPDSHPVLTTAQLLGLSWCVFGSEGRS